MKNIFKCAILSFIFSPFNCADTPNIAIDKTKNYIVNGGFQQPKVPQSRQFQIYNKAPGWTGLLQIGKGSFYSSLWKSGQVLQLDVYMNQEVTQEVNLPSSGKYILKFDQVAREGRSLLSSGLQVYWNGVLMLEIVPKDYKIVQREILLIGKPGINKLSFLGIGINDSNGSTIDNVALYKVQENIPVKPPTLSNQPSLANRPTLVNEPIIVSQPKTVAQPNLVGKNILENPPIISNQPTQPKDIIDLEPIPTLNGPLIKHSIPISVNNKNGNPFLIQPQIELQKMNLLNKNTDNSNCNCVDCKEAKQNLQIQKVKRQKLFEQDPYYNYGNRN